MSQAVPVECEAVIPLQWRVTVNLKGLMNSTPWGLLGDEVDVSVDGDYEPDDEPGQYGVMGGAILLIADSVGTGVLALPGDARRLGLAGYWMALAATYMLNISAGSLLNVAARGTRARDLSELASTLQPQRGLLHFFIDLAWYSNLFLVLGEYVLVMSRGLEMTVGASCAPISSFAAASFALALAQRSRTMAKLHGPALISIASVVAILIACVVALQVKRHARFNIDLRPLYHKSNIKLADALRIAAAVSSIVFAAGTQKLLLNVRKEQREPSKMATPSLVVAVTAFTLLYATVVIAAGPRPPDFLLDALDDGNVIPALKPVAGLLLFAHVAVSYAINLQALAKSIERAFFAGSNAPPRRWFCLTVTITCTAWLVANAVPFFADLVSLVGALASAPLAFAIPAALFAVSPAAKVYSNRASIEPHLHGVLTLLIQVAGTAGSVASIAHHWEHHHSAFECKEVYPTPAPATSSS